MAALALEFKLALKLEATMRILKAAFIGLALCLPQPVAAGPLEDGAAALKRKDFATALRLLRPLAEQGGASAQAILGSMYRYGQGVPQDYRQAVKWLRKGAEQGNAAAATFLGGLYFLGEGVTEDYKEAVKWYRKGAELGLGVAAHGLGVAYFLGRGVIQDNVYAHMWLNIAAANGAKRSAEVREILSKRMTSQQIAEAQKLARECVRNRYKGC